MPGGTTKKIDPALLDFYPSSLKDTDKELLKACQDLVITRTDEIKQLFSYVAQPLNLKGSAYPTAPQTETPMGVQIVRVRHAKPNAMLYLVEGMGWAIGIPRTPMSDEMTFFHRDIDAWMAANFKELISALHTTFALARHLQSERVRREKIQAITALEQGDGRLDEPVTGHIGPTVIVAP